MKIGSSLWGDGSLTKTRSHSDGMVLLLTIVLAFFVPWPWNLLVLLGGVLLEIGEVIWGLRLARRWRPKTGREAMIGMRAEPYAYGAPEYVDMELFLMWRARGMKIESPAVRP